MKIYVHWFENLKPTAAESCEMVYCGLRRADANAAAERVLAEKGRGVVMWIDGTRPLKVKTAGQMKSAARLRAKLDSAKAAELRAAEKAASAEAEQVPVAKKKAKRKRAAKKAVAEPQAEAAADVPAESGGMAAGILEGNNELL